MPETRFNKEFLNFIKKESGIGVWHRCFPVNFAKFLRAPFLQKPSGRLLLLVFKDDLPQQLVTFLRKKIKQNSRYHFYVAIF